jgi:2-isopropylmalate synthase
MLKLTELSRYVDEIANFLPDERQPYVGSNAFAHKAGVHASAVARNTKTYEHVAPEQVGNERRILISELAGKSNISSKPGSVSVDLEKDPQAAARIITMLKKLEHEGYQFEDADGSFALLTQKATGAYKPYFNLLGFRVAVECDAQGSMVSEATIKLDVDGKVVHTVAEGDGPVNALDTCLRKALEHPFPELKDMSLRDFKVRVINGGASTAAKVRVFIESKDRVSSWGTVGISENIIEASWIALADAVEYKLLKTAKKKRK